MSHSDTRKIPPNNSNNSPINNRTKTEYEKLIMAITTLSNKVDTIMDNRTNDKRQRDLLNDHIFNTSKQQTSPRGDGRFIKVHHIAVIYRISLDTAP